MPTNMNEYNRGFDAYEHGDDFDQNQSQDWQDGYFDAQAEDSGCAC